MFEMVYVCPSPSYIFISIQNFKEIARKLEIDKSHDLQKVYCSMNLTSCHNLANSCVRRHIKERNGNDLDEPMCESPEL